MVDLSSADSFVLGAAPDLVTALQGEMEKSSTALRTTLESVRRQTVSVNRDFTIQALERAINACDGLRATLGPLHRMVDKYINEKKG